MSLEREVIHVDRAPGHNVGLALRYGHIFRVCRNALLLGTRTVVEMPHLWSVAISQSFHLIVFVTV